MRVGIVVDNPRRDLRGMLLLGKKFLDKEFEVFIIPNYHLYESFLLKLDWIILHNCRPMQKKYISLFIKLDIRIAILDTEGAQLGPNNKDLKYFANVVSHNLKHINLYFIWGEMQKKIINNKLDELDTKHLINRCKITGHPRFELYQNQYLELNEPIEKNTKIVSFNTNFVWNSPRFSKNAENELMIGVNQYYGDKNIAKEKFYNELHLKKNFIDTIKFVANKFKEYKIIINPHPFEKIYDYLELAKSFNNIVVVKDIYLPKLFKASDYIISYNCQTCVDSYLMGYKTLSINFIDHKDQLTNYFQSICININSKEELLNILQNKKFNKNHEETNNDISKLFYNHNSSSDSIVNLILNYNKPIENKIKITNLSLFYEILFFAKTSHLSFFKIIAKSIMILFSSSHHFYKIKCTIRKNYFNKKYTLTDVVNFYNMLYKNETIKVRNAYAKKFSIFFKKLSTFEIQR